MSWDRFLVVSALVLILGRPGPARAASPEEGQKLAAEVRAVFAARCARCHGPDVARPKGRFGYVLDLKRLAGDPEKVVPGRPDESELWSLVSNGDMPPSSSPTGPLSEKQKEVVRAWIAAGAPSGEAAAVAPASAAGAPEEEGPAPAPPPPLKRGLLWLGKFHLLFIHFPIAFLLAAGAAEVWSLLRKERGPSALVRACLWAGAASALPTVALGWLFAWGGNGAGSPRLLGWHRWLGTTTAFVAVGALIASEWWDQRRGRRGWPARLLVLASSLLVALTAHFGGLMVHGREFFDP
jgi:mono/diheme cytochrome c family protein